MKFRKLMGVAAVSAAVASLAACGGSSDSRPTADLRIVHAATDAPDVRVNLQNDGIDENASVRLNRLGFAQSSAFQRVRPSRYNVTVDAYLPGGVTLDGVIDETLLFERDRQWTLVATGLLDDGTFGPVVIETERAPVSAGQARVQLVHAAPGAPAVDIYLAAIEPVLPPEDDEDGDGDGDGGDEGGDDGEGGLDPQGLTTLDESFDCTAGEPVVVDASFGAFTDRLEVPAGDYQICVTLAASQTRVFESDIVGLRAGDDLLVSAIDSAGASLQIADNSPINLLVSFPNATSSLVLRDINDRAALNVVHAAAGVGDAEVYFAPQAAFIACVNGDEDHSDVCTDPTIPSIAFGDSLRTDVDAGSYALRVNAEGAGAAEAPIAANHLMVGQGRGYIAIAGGHAVDVEAELFPLFLERQTRPIATQASLRIVHAGSLSGPVAVFVTEAGDITDADVQFAEVAPDFTLDVRRDSGYLVLPGGDYDIRIAVPLNDGGFDVIYSESGAIDNGSILDLIIRNPDEDEGFFEVELLDIGVAIG